MILRKVYIIPRLNTRLLSLNFLRLTTFPVEYVNIYISNLKMKRLILALSFLLVLTGLFAQPGSYPDGYEKTASCENAAAYMMNETMHGLLIIQRIFENDNQTLNQFANLDSRKINFYGNEDLPKNVFFDPEHLFYAVPPYQWSLEIDKRCNSLSPEIKSQIKDIKNLLDEINQMRFTIDEGMRSKDLNNPAQLTAVYTLMEQAASYCENLLTARNRLQVIIPFGMSNATPEQQNLLKLIMPVYKSAEQLILAVRKDDEPKVRENLKKLKESYGKLKLQQTAVDKLASKIKKESVDRFTQSFGNIVAKAAAIISEAEAYLGTTPINEQYKAYGRNYYYYNVKLLSLFNRYGKGLASEFNQFILYGDIKVASVMELPHYVKIIYPEKRPELVRSIVATDVVETLPQNLRNRKVVQRQHAIIADGPDCLLEIYDNQEEDGDIISINYNGVWVVENYALRKESLKIPVLLNKDGENFLLLHAENTGKIPPNTIAINYIYQGKKKRVVLNSSMMDSEMIRIEPNLIK